MLFIKKIKELPVPVSDFIKTAGSLADDKNVRAYIVGGFVRDLYLKVPNFDIDFVVEGDGIKFAEELAKKLSCQVLTHKRFGTATITGLAGFKADIASARKEIYEKPAALPTVSYGVIQDDLFRRDFTINAMAISINSSSFGELIDFYGGQDDLKKRLVRALHPLSFIDDPTRILRAVRFEQRYDFKIEAYTRSWIKTSVKRNMLGVVQKHRLRDEIVLIFKEAVPYKILRRLHNLSGFSYISKDMRLYPRLVNYFHEAERRISWYRQHFSHRRHIEPYIVFMSLFFYSLRLKEIKKIMSDFAFHKGESSRIISLKENFVSTKKGLLKKNISSSAVYRLLEPLAYEVILSIIAMAGNKLVSSKVDDFLAVYNGQRLSIKGEDLSELGIGPGPHFKKILHEILMAKIDGKVKDKEEELELAKRLFNSK